jgi:hypothetical protein
MDGTLPNFESTRWGAHYTEIDLASTFRGGQGKNYKFACNQDQQVDMVPENSEKSKKTTFVTKNIFKLTNFHQISKAKLF